MSHSLDDMTRDALRDLASVRQLGGHTDMTRDALIDALETGPEDDIAPYLGLPRKEIYETAKARGIEGAMDMDKRSLILRLAGREGEAQA